MNYETIKIRDFFSPIYMTSFLSKNYRISEDQSAIFKNNQNVMLFELEALENYRDYGQIELFGVDAEEYSEFAKLKIPHSKKKKPMVVSQIDEDLIKLHSKRDKKIRNAVTQYTKRTLVEVRDEPNSINEIITFIKLWELIRTKAHFMLHSGYDKNFFLNYYEDIKDKLISRFFYFMDELVGYSIIEPVNEHLYNILFRKANTNFSQLTQHVDYAIFNDIYNDIGHEFLVNWSGFSNKGQRYYKENTFQLFKTFDVWSIII